MLNQFDEISAPHPPHVLKTFVPILEYYGDLNDQDRFSELANDIATFVNANPVPWLLDHLTASDLTSTARSNSLLSLYEAVYTIKMNQDKAQAWCCKSMFNEYYSESIESEGIVPFYIYLVRDGRDVSASFKKALVGPKHVYFLAKKWQEDQLKALEIKQRVDPSRFFELKYEELVSSPKRILRELSRTLGVQYSDKLLAYYTSDESIRTASSGEMWKNVANPLMKQNVGKYKTELTGEEVRLFEKIAGEMLLDRGYELEFELNETGTEGFTDDDIRSFSLLNDQLQHEARLNANKHDLQVRGKQELVLNEIHRRLGLS